MNDSNPYEIIPVKYNAGMFNNHAGFMSSIAVTNLTHDDIIVANRFGIIYEIKSRLNVTNRSSRGKVIITQYHNDNTSKNRDPLMGGHGNKVTIHNLYSSPDTNIYVKEFDIVVAVKGLYDPKNHPGNTCYDKLIADVISRKFNPCVVDPGIEFYANVSTGTLDDIFVRIGGKNIRVKTTKFSTMNTELVIYFKGIRFATPIQLDSGRLKHDFAKYTTRVNIDKVLHGECIEAGEGILVAPTLQAFDHFIAQKKLESGKVLTAAQSEAIVTQKEKEIDDLRQHYEDLLRQREIEHKAELRRQKDQAKADKIDFETKYNKSQDECERLKRKISDLETELRVHREYAKAESERRKQEEDERSARYKTASEKTKLAGTVLKVLLPIITPLVAAAATWLVIKLKSAAA